MILKIAKRGIADKLNYEFIKADNIEYYGRILSDSQISTLKTYGNVVICESLYAAFPEEVILREITSLTGLTDLEFHVVPDLCGEDRTIIVRRIPKK